jgi:hypothetical protein
VRDVCSNVRSWPTVRSPNPLAWFAAAGNVNVYDVREPCTYPPLCYDLSPIGKYLNLPATRRKLGVGDRQWQACSGAVRPPLFIFLIHLPK